VTDEYTAELIHRLASRRGIGEAYHDHRGELKQFSLRTRAEILRAMGCDVDDPAQLEDWLRQTEQLKPVSAGDGPQRCYEPPALTQGERAWGLTVQLYSLRSRDNWGMGDFADLEQLLRHAAANGAAFVGVNPLHALFLSQPAHCSPYGASSRLFLNPLYIAVPRVAEFVSCETIHSLLQEPEFAARLDRLSGRSGTEAVCVRFTVRRVSSHALAG
jgi:4-alpha-glucanotransferase